MPEDDKTLPLGGGKKPQNQPSQRTEQEPMKAKPPATASETGWFEVTKGGRVQRSGGVAIIPEGKQINSASYDVKKLRQAGIELKPIDEPAWFTAAQGTAALVILALSLMVGVAACSGEPVAGGMPTGAELCAMNPIASSCTNVESVQGAVFGPPNFTSDWTAWWGDYKCTPTDSVTWHIGGRTHTTRDTYSSLWRTRYEAVDLYSYSQWFGVTLSVAPLINLENAMDGPYHVVYNTVPYTEGVCLKTRWHSQCMLATIPPYGTWIYAPNERSDYPGGVQIVTVDPQEPDPANGACNKRLQFVVPL